MVKQFWGSIFNIKNDLGTDLCYPTLKLLVEAVSFLPHSNTELERTFSDVNDIKDRK